MAEYYNNLPYNHGNFSLTGHQGSTWMFFRGALSYGDLGCASPSRSTNIGLHPPIWKVGRLRHVIQYGSFLLPFSWLPVDEGRDEEISTWDKKRELLHILLCLFIYRLLSAMTELLGQYETTCTRTRRGLSTAHPHQPLVEIIKYPLRHL